MLMFKKNILKLCVTSVLVSVLTLLMVFVGNRAAFACTPSGASCDDTSSVSITFGGSLSDIVNNAAITSSATLTGGTQTITFSIGTTLSDSRGGTAAWQLSASSAGIAIATATGSSTKPFVLTSSTGACASTGSCSGTVVDRTGGGLTLTDTAQAMCQSAAGGDFGESAITTLGDFVVDGSTMAGTDTGSITITLATAITL